MDSSFVDFNILEKKNEHSLQEQYHLVVKAASSIFNQKNLFE